MYFIGRTVVYEETTCYGCYPSGSGRVYIRVKCPTCKGTRKGPRGGAGGCKTCYDGSVYSDKLTEICSKCGGEGKVPETRYSHVSREDWQDMPFVVYRDQYRKQSFAERFIGVGVYSVSGMDPSYLTDEQLIEEVRNGSTTHQACKIVDEAGMRCNHIGILTAEYGYAVIPVWMEGV